MYLKHLALQGYKSFANKTKFEFSTGITAVVGPNGTGKSNIADAIRWALGERSMSTLRAKSTSDMIFAGGNGRARAGMAEVALTFDNAAGDLPIEYSEVTIARRAYRSGENEYLINGSQVLLRDIEELLAESSLSERTYTVIGQGVVDAALALRPQERRALFEEAAGITLHRDRREKTVERLDETERNLDRVRDIIAEIAPRVERLERDARRVEEHRRLRMHLERLQTTWYGHRWGQQQAALEGALQREAALKEKLAARQREAAAAAGTIDELRERESALRAKLREWYRRSGDMHEDADKARRELAVAEERERLLHTRREELLEEIEPLRIQRQGQEKRVASLRQEVRALESELVDRRERLEEAQSRATELGNQAQKWERKRLEVENKLRNQRAEFERLDRAATEAREEISRLASERVVAEERVRQLESRRDEVVATLEPLGQEKEQQMRRVARQRTELHELEQSLARRRSELADLQQRWHAFQGQSAQPGEERIAIAEERDRAQAEVQRLEEARRDLKEEEADLAGEIKALERLHATGAAYNRGVQSLVESSVRGVLGRLAGLIHVAQEWECAVEAVLDSGVTGNALQAVVVEGELAVDEARRVLEREGGRATLGALDCARALTRDRELPPGTLSAADVVTCDEEVGPLVEVLLGQVAVCEDLAEAKTLRSQMPPGGCCVTRDGAVVRVGGIYVFGEMRSGGVLADERARQELPRRLEELRQRLGGLERRRLEEEERVLSLESRLSAIDSTAARAREEQAQVLQEKLTRARTAAAVANETLRGQRTALQREEAELKRIQGRQEALRKQVSVLEEERAAQIERAQGIRMALDAPQAEIPEGQQEPVDASVSEAAQRYRRRLGEAEQHRRKLEQQQRASSQRIASFEEQLSDLAHKAAEAREEAARFEREVSSDARTAVAVAEASHGSKRQALERESNLLERLSSQVDARRERARDLKAERENLVDLIAKLQEEASRLDAELRDVRKRIGPAEEALEALDEQRQSWEDRRQQVGERMRAAEGRHGHAELEVERRRDDLQALAQRIDEELGLVELELGESVTAQAPLPMRPIVSALPVVEELPEGLEDEMQFVRRRLRRLGAFNPNAPDELAEVRERYEFLSDQAADLQAAIQQLRQSVAELEAMMRQAFGETFEAVSEHFAEMFSHLFEGGEARLTLTEPGSLLTTGIEIVARPPRKRAQRLALLSGGERALTAVALLFSLLRVSPTPFCVLDEVDAMLDEANVGRFRTKLEELAQQTQFIVITHNRSTVESAETVYGVSMGGTAVSQVVSLRMGEVQSEA